MKFKFFKHKHTPASTDNEIPGDPTTGTKLFCGEHFDVAYWEKTGTATDGDGRLAGVYKCPTCSHVLWDTEKEFRESLC
ncbi:hypothetical protein [Gordonia aichiensis]|uniref:hypothetical protein n=1 Tax=Gordonia aichiensis TaxID=36820 RepID=UPI003266FBAB